MTRQTGRWSVDSSTAIGLPQSVREVIEHRVERLGDETRQVLTMASVIGRSFGVELLARLVEMGEARLLDRLEAAVAASLLDESTERGRAVPVCSCADQPDAVRNAGGDAARADAPRRR